MWTPNPHCRETRSGLQGKSPPRTWARVRSGLGRPNSHDPSTPGGVVNSRCLWPPGMVRKPHISGRQLRIRASFGHDPRPRRSVHAHARQQPVDERPGGAVGPCFRAPDGRHGRGRHFSTGLPNTCHRDLETCTAAWIIRPSPIKTGAIALEMDVCHIRTMNTMTALIGIEWRFLAVETPLERSTVIDTQQPRQSRNVLFRVRSSLEFGEVVAYHPPKQLWVAPCSWQRRHRSRHNRSLSGLRKRVPARRHKRRRPSRDSRTETFYVVQDV